MRYSKPLSRVGATALAAATVVAGIGFGPAATAATPAAAAVTVPFVMTADKSTFWGMTRQSGATHFTKYGDSASAIAASRSVTLPTDSWTTMSYVTNGSTYCMNVDRTTKYLFGTGDCTSDTAQFRLTDGQLVNKANPTLHVDDFRQYGTGPQAHFGTGSTKYSVDAFVAANGGFDATGVPVPKTLAPGTEGKVSYRAAVRSSNTRAITGLTGTKQTILAPAGTRFTSGTARVVGYVQAPDGSWPPVSALVVTGALTGADRVFTGTIANTANGFSLQPGALVHWEIPVTVPADAADGTKPMSFEVTGTSNAGPFTIEGETPVTIKSTPLTAAVDSVDDAAATADVSGTARAGAVIVGPGGFETTSDADGRWSGTVTGLAVGSNDVTFTQMVAGKPSGSVTIQIEVAAPAAAPLEVLTPATGQTVDTKRPVFSGTGDKGATIEVRGSSRVVASAIVDPDGKWTVPADFDLADGKYALTAKQTATTGDVQSKPVTFSVQHAAESIALTATAAFDSDESKPATVSGAANTGATVIVRDADGKELARTTAAGNRYSVAIPGAAAHQGMNDFSVTQTVKGEASAPVRASLDYGTMTPLAITSPEDGDTVHQTDITFTGTGHHGAKVIVRGSSSTIASGTVVDGVWKATVERTLTPTTYRLWAVQTGKGGLTSQQEITIRVADQSSRFTATAAFDAADPNLPATITGAARSGAVVAVKNANGAVIGTTTAVAAKYSATIPAAEADFGVNSFAITQTVDGTESAPLMRTLDYGNPAAPVITTPARNSTVAPGKVTFTGIGAEGTAIAIRGTVSTIGTGTVQNGLWSLETKNLTPNVYRLFALQTSKGGLTKQTETLITVAN